MPPNGRAPTRRRWRVTTYGKLPYLVSGQIRQVGAGKRRQRRQRRARRRGQSAGATASTPGARNSQLWPHSAQGVHFAFAPSAPAHAPSIAFDFGALAVPREQFLEQPTIHPYCHRVARRRSARWRLSEARVEQACARLVMRAPADSMPHVARACVLDGRVCTTCVGLVCSMPGG